LPRELKTFFDRIEASPGTQFFSGGPNDDDGMPPAVDGMPPIVGAKVSVPSGPD
jgi:hypothetical protein